MMNKFEYDVPAEVYSSDGRGASKRPVACRRFEHSAEAIRFTVEQLPQPIQPWAVMEVDGDRIKFAHIRALYDSERYPLSRRDPQLSLAGLRSGKCGQSVPRMKLRRRVVARGAISDARFS